MAMHDFLYGSEDLGSPVAGNLFQGGLIGEPLTALASHNKSCLLFGAEDSLWVMRATQCKADTSSVLAMMLV